MLLFCFFLSCIGTIAPSWRVVCRATLMQALLLAGTFVWLVDAFLTRRCTLELVALNTHPDEPALYRLMGALGTYEGSLLFFTLLIGGYGALYAIRSPKETLTLRVQNLIVSLLLSFMASVANPFRPLANSTLVGSFNPLLEDSAMSFHPPLLYFGTTGLSLVFSITCAALFEHWPVPRWVGHIRPWLLLAWALLTLGVVSGSWWAYYQFGWGGYWAWDPTENTALAPWLLTCVLFHLLPTIVRSGRFWAFVSFLGLACFVVALLGTFLVRSGLLISVHAFGVNQERTWGLLLISAVLILLGALAWLKHCNQPHIHPLVKRESIVFLAMIMLFVSFAVVCLGVLIPLVAPVSIQASFYVRACLPFAATALFLLPLAIRAPQFSHLVPFGLLAVCVALYPLLAHTYVWCLPLGLFLCVWIILATLRDCKRPRIWGRMIAHIGLGILIFGITAMASWQKEALVSMQPGDHFTFNGQHFTFTKLEEQSGEDYQALTATITTDDHNIFRPQLRHFPSSKQTTIQSALHTSWLSQTIIALSVREDNQALLCHITYNPFVLCIWLGGVGMACGILFAMISRVYEHFH